ncbi:hypothetical protein LEP3755_66620 (plasmid) [Leptolyngbya sp. NIES-3755]|nr:hypothetical protein LEP3755_66620 [Leptolyngbya sp. NIES-3755]
MATSKPSVVAYLESPIYEHLVEFKNTHHLRSLSQAVEVILDEYFGGEPAFSSTHSVTQPTLTLAERVDRLSANYEFLNQSIFNLQQMLLTLTASSSSSAIASLGNHPSSSKKCNQSPSDCTKDSSSEQLKDLRSGLTGTDLALRLKVCLSTLSRRRSKSSFQSWSRYQDPDDIAWTYSKDARYRPLNLETISQEPIEIIGERDPEQ